MLAYITGTTSRPEVVALTDSCQLLGPATDRVGEVGDQDTSSKYDNSGPASRRSGCREIVAGQLAQWAFLHNALFERASEVPASGCLWELAWRDTKDNHFL
jgi:hypothetical protein